ncbi:MAG TPA: NUDIX hydrolase [Candidatus Binatia bacterium]|jgi:ADP-ribose pyrophosphatase|nr:NUDIX hydrolase [Candidatus Binatia bacterium]
MRRTIFDGRVVHLGIESVQLPNGATIDLEVIRHPGASAVVAVDEQDRVVLIRQYRHAGGGYLWELPAGVLDAPDEPPEACAARELQEETGLTATEITRLGSVLPTPGYSDERIHLFLARGLREGETNRGADEDIAETRRVPLSEALEMVRRGDIVDGKTVAGLHLAAAMLLN